MKWLWRIAAAVGLLMVLALGWLWTQGIPGWWFRVIAWFEEPVEMQVIEASVMPHQVSPRENLPASGPALWCVTTDAAWQQLRGHLGGVGPVVADRKELCGWLNAEPDAGTMAPPSSLFTFSGRAAPASWASLTKGLEASLRTSPGIPPPKPIADGWMMYAHLNVVAEFAIPYLDTPDGLEFTGEDGVPLRVRAFGTIPRSGARMPDGLADQPKVLYDSATSERDPETFVDPAARQCAINLSGSDAPVQIIVALMPRPATLHDGWAAVQAEARSHEPLPLRSSLAVPLLAFRSTASLTPLVGPLSVPPGAGTLANADQVIEFRLDRTGASLKAETMLMAVSTERTVPAYRFDRPFLLAMKRRDADAPFFLAWVTEKSGLTVRRR